jgi:hypothetical protein
MREAELVRLHMEQMDLRQRIGQRFMILVPEKFGEKPSIEGPIACFGNETAPSYRFVWAAIAGKPAGMILDNPRYGNREEAERLTEDLQEIAEASQPGRGFLISIEKAGEYKDADLEEVIAYVTGQEILSMDVNRVREQMGFDGVVMSDGIDTDALADKYDLDTILELAINSGVDIIQLRSKYNLLDVIDRVEKMVQDGRLTEDQIDNGVERILGLKYRHGLLEVPG